MGIDLLLSIKGHQQLTLSDWSPFAVGGRSCALALPHQMRFVFELHVLRTDLDSDVRSC